MMTPLHPDRGQGSARGTVVKEMLTRWRSGSRELAS
jgi:hypothetical protein